MKVRYCLSVCGLVLAFQWLAAFDVAGQEEPDARAVAEYRLTDERLENFVRASRNLQAVLEADPDLLAELEGEGEEFSIAETAARWDSLPAIRNAIQSAGMTSTEYITFTFAMFQAGMGAWMVEQGGAGRLPAGVARENVDYYLANKARFEALSEELPPIELNPE